MIKGLKKRGLKSSRLQVKFFIGNKPSKISNKKNYLLI